MLLAKLDAVTGHGHNLDALWDGLTSDLIQMAPPYEVVVSGREAVSPDLSELIDQIALVFRNAWLEEGVNVHMRVTCGPS